MKRIQLIIILVCVFSTASAVSINQGGMGEAVVLPYYTVNNNLNTLLTINNSTDMTKAVKVHFREGKEGKAVLTFNLFLGPNDMWAAGLAETMSTIAGHTGEKTARLLYVDGSCAPFLVSGQEFLPFEIDAESDDTDLARSTEGYIEILEMGELDPQSGLGSAAVMNNGVANDCAALQAAYNTGGVWDEVDGDFSVQMLPVNGGLTATASLIDVAEGTMYSMNGVAFENFYPEDTSDFHTSPGDTRVPSLNQADTSSVAIINGELITTEWQQGYQAVSALLMKYQVEGFYDLNQNIIAKTEVVMSMPTKRFYETDDNGVELPFTETDDEQYNACGSYDVVVTDRDSLKICNNDTFAFNCTNFKSADLPTPKLTPVPPPVDFEPQFCFAVNVVQMVNLDSTPEAVPSTILGSAHVPYRDVFGYESGKLLMNFEQRLPAPGDVDYHGLPMIGFTLTKYTNANAAPGLLAQYGGINKVNYKSKVDSL